jgi:ribose transport system permease protein
MIGVYIMSVLRAGLPSMDLQSQYQTFFTGVVVLGAVMLDIYRTKKSTEVRILTPSAQYKEDMLVKIGNATSSEQAASLKAEMRQTYAKMRREEKSEAAKLRREEKGFVKR